MPKTAAVVLAFASVVSAVLLAILIYLYAPTRAEPDLSGAYHAVLLTNGQAFFGRIEKANTAFPVLRDAFSLQNRMDPETKQVSSTLIRRSQELHEPDVTILKGEHILVIEPVKAGSRLDQLIEGARKAAQPPAK